MNETDEEIKDDTDRTEQCCCESKRNPASVGNIIDQSNESANKDRLGVPS